MGVKTQLTQKRITTSIKAGAAGVILSLILLLPGAAFIYTCMLSMAQSKWIVLASVYTGTLLSQILYHQKQKGRGMLLTLVLSETVYMISALIVSFELPGAELDLTQLLPLFALSAAGNASGILIIFNKLYKRKNGNRKRYTKRNQRKKFT